MSLSAVNEPECKVFSDEDVLDLSPNLVPRHIAIIMDGNRRWAKANDLPPNFGHIQGARQLKDITKAAIELKIETLTVYSFSTENRNRSKEEVADLLDLFKKYLISEQEEMVNNGIKLETIGDVDLLPEDIIQTLRHTKEITKNGKSLNLVIAINYGSRDEITRAIKKISLEYQDKKLDVDAIDEAKVSQYLDTARWPDPDMLIRTSGEMRLSNFLLWQVSYTEIFITDKLWPDFNPQDLLIAIKNYQRREVRKGT